MRLFLIALTALFLSSCCTPKQAIVMYEKHTIETIVGFEDILQPAVLPPPPTPEKFMALSTDEREDAALRVYLDAIEALHFSNMDKQSVLDIIAKINAKINEYNALEEARYQKTLKSKENSQ